MINQSKENRDLTITIQISSDAERLDQALLKALQKLYPSVSRAKLKTYFQNNQVRLGKHAVSASKLLSQGEYEISISQLKLDAPRALPDPKGSFLPILYEDEDLLILNKKTGVPSVPHSNEETGTAVNSALAYLPDLIQVGDHHLEPGLLHRLDTGTSGVLAIAKSQTEFERIKKLWKTDAVEKHYRAICTPLSTSFSLPLTLRTPIAHDSRSSKKMLIVTENVRDSQIRGKPLPAMTHILSEKKLDPATFDQNNFHFSDLHIRIETGVMHQIRCHLASIDCPIWGDPIYHSDFKKLVSQNPALETRLWLHAWKLRLPLKTGQTLEVTAELPENWPR